MDTAIVGLGTAVLGFVGGLLTPWVRWQIDKRRAVRREKAEHISQWREVIDQFDFNNDSFGDTAWYSSLRGHMRPEIIEKVEADRTVYVGGGRGEQVIKHMLLDEVARVERCMWRE